MKRLLWGLVILTAILGVSCASYQIQQYDVPGSTDPRYPDPAPPGSPRAE